MKNKSLDYLSKNAFVTDEQGQTVFSPWHFRGKGYVVPDEAAQKKIVRFLNRFFLIVFGYSIFFGCAVIALTVWPASPERLRQSDNVVGICLILYLFGFVFIAFWYSRRIDALTTNLLPSDFKLSWRAILNLSLEGFSFRFLWAILILCVLLGAIQRLVLSDSNPLAFVVASLYAFMIYCKTKLRR